MLEKDIESQILKWLNFQPGVFAFKINTVGVYDASRGIYRTNRNPFVIRGTSDILGVVDGKFIAIEVKTPKTIKKVSPHQQAFLDKIAHMGGHSIAVSSLTQVVEFIENMKKIVV